MLKEMEVANIAALYTRNISYIKNLNGFHNYIYEVCGDETFILRISVQNSSAATSSEIDFLRYLYKNNVPVAPPIISLQEQYAHNVVINNRNYVASAYQKADGKDFRSRSVDGKERFIIIGRTLGKMHRLSKIYTPSIDTKRRQWYESSHIQKAATFFSVYNVRLLEKFNGYMSFMRKFPKNKNSFGLVHGDFLFSNYFFDESDRITIFDFDECEYSWYIYDIGVCMCYYLLGGDPRELDKKVEEAEEMFYHMLVGYMSECEIDIDCLRDMNSFFQLREYILLSSILETSMNDLNGWSKDFVEGAIDRILTSKPFINVDFEKVYNKVAQDKL